MQLDRKRLIQKLWWVMSLYCTKHKYSVEFEKQILFMKYKVTSRTQLTNEQLEQEIENYKAWLEYD